MDWEEAIEIIDYTMEQQVNEQIIEKQFQLYSAIYPLMMLDNIKAISFQEFKDKLEGKEVNKNTETNYKIKTDSEMLEEIEELERLEKLKKGGK